MIAYATLLDAAARHFRHAAASPSYTREARHLALQKEREVQAELDSLNSGRPLRRLCLPEPRLPPEWLDFDPEFRRAING